MRVAPAGLFYERDEAFDMAVDFPELTHGHPSGYLSAGALAYHIATIIEGVDIEGALDNTLRKLKGYENHEECTYSLRKAIESSKSDHSDTEAIQQLGEGWIGEEALAISVYCSLKYHNNFKKALIVSVNHDGDSDSTGAITGNILGAYLGLSQIPETWIEKVELKEVLVQVADDLIVEYNEDNLDWDRYPGY